jgi:plastocyanin
MSRRLMLLTALAATLLAGVAAGPVQGARHHVTKKTVTVGDDYFAPSKFTKAKHLKVGTRVVFHWPATNSDTHDVKFTKTPRHVRHYHSPPATAGFRWSRTLHKRGVYRFICTFHPATMRGVIVVKR